MQFKPRMDTDEHRFSYKGTRTWAFTCPTVALTKLMVQQTLATPPRCPGG